MAYPLPHTPTHNTCTQNAHMYKNCPHACITHATLTACKTCNMQHALVHLHEYQLCIRHTQHTDNRHTSHTTYTQHTRAHTAWLKRPGALRGKSALAHPHSHSLTFLRKRSDGLKVILRSRSALSVQPGSGFRVGWGQRSAIGEERTQSPCRRASHSAPAPLFSELAPHQALLSRRHQCNNLMGKEGGHKDHVRLPGLTP